MVWMCSSIIGILWQINQLGSFGYLSTAVAINRDIWFLTLEWFGKISKYLKLYFNFIIEINIYFVGWFIESVVFMNKSLNICFLRVFILVQHKKSFWMISLWMLHLKKWFLSSFASLKELHKMPVSANFEVMFLKYWLFLNSFIMNCSKKLWCLMLRTALFFSNCGNSIVISILCLSQSLSNENLDFSHKRVHWLCN